MNDLEQVSVEIERAANALEALAAAASRDDAPSGEILDGALCFIADSLYQIANRIDDHIKSAPE